METNPVDELAEVNRLRTATAVEAEKTPRGAFVVLAVATVLFFSCLAIDRVAVQMAAIVAWTVFVALWVHWVRTASRVRPGQAGLTRPERSRRILEWLALLAVANVISQIGYHVSWVLAGVLFALLGATTGGFLNWRSSTHG